MSVQSWQDQFNRELAAAENARSQGLEGQARVCARRAAGAALRQFHQRGSPSNNLISAYDLIRQYAEDENLSPEVHSILSMLQMRVLPGGEFPLNVDIISQVRRLPELLGLT